jgi:endo-1,4-beta-xylanase
MKTHHSNLSSRISWFVAVLLAVGATAWSAATPTLKDAYKGHFYIGAAINRTIATGTAVQADNVNRTLEEVKADAALVLAQYNQIVNENDLKWVMIQPNPGPDGYDFAPADAFVEFGVKNNMYIAGHTLVWHSQVPGWLFQADPYETPQAAPAQGPGGRRGRSTYSGPRATREQLLERMRNHIHTVVGRYKGKIHVWDVVNEALADGGNEILRSSPWTQIIGPDFIAKAFEYAHEADPDVILRYNDYGLENPAKRERLKKLIKQLQEQNVPVHAIGTQTHINVSTTFETMDETLRDLASIGLPIHITELDVNAAARGQRTTSADITGAAERAAGGVVSEADQRQAKAYADLFRAIMKHKDSVKVVTFWGANDAVSWLGRGTPLLFDGANQPKPAFHAVIDVATEK